MTRQISPLAHIDPRAELGDGVEIGPFCVVGPHVQLGDDCKLDSLVTISGHTTIGARNRFFPGTHIGGEPQDVSYKTAAPTRLEIGDDNTFREGFTAHRGAEKEDGVTRIGHRNYFMCNSHVGHNSHVYNNVTICNGSLLAGHVHVHDYAMISGNCAVHQFTSIGTLAFVSGMSRATFDVPPFFMLAGADDAIVTTVNVVGMQRRGISRDTIGVIRKAHRLIYREFKPLTEIWDYFMGSLDGVIPIELSTLLNFVEQSKLGKFGRAREAVRMTPAASKPAAEERRVA